MMQRSLKVGSLVCLIASAAISHAVLFTAEATNNATVRPAGPRGASSGKAYLNVEGNGNGTNASFGVADFSVSSFGIGFTVGNINSVVLSLTQLNAAFTLPGTVRFYLSTDTTTSIESTNTALKFDSTKLPGGIGTQLSTLYDLGTGVFSATGNTGSGTVDSYTLNLTGAAKSYLISQLNTTGATLRFVITPDTNTTAATWAGYSNTTYDGPTLKLDAGVVPEPATILGLVLGAGALISRRRRA